MISHRAVHALFAAVLVAATAAMSGCSQAARDAIRRDTEQALSQASRNAVELTARNMAADQGAEEFTKAGITLTGRLSCTATVAGGLADIAVSCTGATSAGAPVALSGQTNEVPGLSVVELDGDFTGSVDGAVVFHTTTLGR